MIICSFGGALSMAQGWLVCNKFAFFGCMYSLLEMVLPNDCCWLHYVVSVNYLSTCITALFHKPTQIHCFTVHWRWTSLSKIIWSKVTKQLINFIIESTVLINEASIRGRVLLLKGLQVLLSSSSCHRCCFYLVSSTPSICFIPFFFFWFCFVCQTVYNLIIPNNKHTFLALDAILWSLMFY